LFLFIVYSNSFSRKNTEAAKKKFTLSGTVADGRNNETLIE
jgi:hypothetical protein